MIKYLILFFVFVSCDTSKKSTEAIFSKDTNICKLNVSFRSIGAGIDRKTHKTFLNYIEQFEKEEKVKLAYDKIFWGREGEVDYCFQYNSLSQKQIIKFEQQLKEVFVESKSVYSTKDTEKRKGR
jgi:hypothetical protein